MVRRIMSSIQQIQVNTDELRSNAGTLEGIGTDVSGIIGELQSSANSICAGAPGEYQGQLEAATGGLLGQAANGSANIQAELEKLSYELNARAAAFDNANVPSGKVLSGMFGTNGIFSNTPLLALFAGLAGLQIGIANFVFRMTGFRRGSVSRYTKTPNLVPTEKPKPAASSPPSTSSFTSGKNNNPVQGGNPKLTNGIHYSGESKRYADNGFRGARGVSIDIGANNASEAKIHSLESGKVIGVGPLLNEKGEYVDYGNYIKVLQDDGKVVIYGHLQEQPSNLNIGDRIESGQGIGAMGSTGRSSGPHLHLEFREPQYDINGKYINDTDGLVKNGFDPIQYLNEKGIKIP